MLEDNLNNDYILPSFNATMFDDAAFEVFFRKHFTSLCAYCQHRFNFDLDLAKDIVHSGFSKLWETRQTISPELSIKAYLYKIITNMSLDILKHDKVKNNHAKRTRENGPAICGLGEYNDIDFKRLEEDIEKAVAALPEQMRKIFKLCRYEEMKYAEIAGELGISKKTVETQMSRALVKLRQKLSYYLGCFLLFLMCFGWLLNIV